MINSTETPKNIKLLNPGPLDAWVGPYASVAEANSKIPNITVDGVNFRKFKTVGITVGGILVKYEWAKGFLDTDLIPVDPFRNKKIINTVKALNFAQGSATLSYDKTTKIITTNSSMYIFNGTFNGTSSYIRINAGSLNLTAAIALYPADNFFHIYVKMADTLLLGDSSSAQVLNMTDLIVKSFSDPTVSDVRSDNGIVVFTYNKLLDTISSPFLSDRILELINAVAEINLGKNKYLNGFKATAFFMGTANVTWDSATKILTTTQNMYVFSATFNTNPCYVRLLPGSLNLTAAIALFPTAEYFYIYIKPVLGFWDGSGGSILQYAMTDLIVKPYLDPTVGDARTDNALLLFQYSKSAGTISSRFFAEKILALTSTPAIDPSIKTQLKLDYQHRGSFTWNDTTKVITWSGQLYIFNRNKTGASAANYIRIDVGSFDFKTYADASVDEFFVAYLKLTTTAQLQFVNGTGISGNILSAADIVYKSWNDAGISDVKENNTVILFYYNKSTGLVSTPFLNADVQTNFLKGGGTSTPAIVTWVNRFPNVYAKLPNFVKKYGYGIGGTGEIKNRIIMLGNSLFARYQHTSVLDVDPKSYPPTFITKNLGAYLWENLKGNKPIYSRYDKTGRFTESGAWVAAVDLAGWDDAGDISNVTRQSADTAANFSFTVDNTFNYFNLIDRKDSLGQTSVVVSVTAGNGVVQARLEGNTVWNEANGFTFSQRNPAANATLGIGNTQYQRRIEFKKISTGINTAQTITVSKGAANADTLMYWGIEEIPGNKPYNQLIDVARGGHTFASLKPYVQTDVFDRKPNLVILEIPLLNMVAANSTIEYTLNELQDFVWGDRVGFLNPLSLKNKSNNWVDFEVLLIVPQHSRVHFNSDSTFAIQTSGYTAEELYNAVKGYIFGRGDVPFIDLSTAFMAEAKADPLFTGNYYSAFASSGVTGTGYFNDGLHQNDKGTLVWAKNLCPIFWLTTS